MGHPSIHFYKFSSLLITVAMPVFSTPT